MSRVAIYDTTLRDGSQGEGVNFSLQDKLLLTRRLDEIGVDYIEGGYPLSNPKDFEYFQAVRELPLKHAKVCAFGMTRRKNAPAETDTCLKALLDAHTPVVTIVGKTWDFHVTNVLGTTLDENLRMIADSVAYCKSQGREVFYDAEHFFDGYRANPEYALQDASSGRECRGERGDPVRHQRRHDAGACRGGGAAREARANRAKSASTATTIATSRWRTRWPRCGPARRRCRAR